MYRDENRLERMKMHDFLNPPDSFLVCYRAGSLVVFFDFPIIYRSLLGREVATYLEEFPVVCCIF